jgi:hypothetical protein
LSTPIEGALAVWYLLTGASLVFLVWDLLTNTPTGRVMKLAWVLVVIYTGPVGLFLYLLSCRQPLPGTHDAFIAPHWKQATGSLLHCVAGDATGIIISAAVVYHFGLPNGIDLIIEYVSAFVVGLFVFQALFMLAMYNGDYWLAVRKTFFAETVSMNMVMVGMIPTMVILMHAIPGAESPFHATFWAVMSLATMAGMATAYPINSWMVRRGLKHGMMSAMPKPKPGATEPMEAGMEMSHDMQPDHGSALPKPKPGATEPMEAGMEMSHDMQSDHGSALPTTKMVAVLVGTFAVLALSLWITTLFAPITFTGLE